MDLRARLALMPPGSLVPVDWVLAQLECERGAAVDPAPQPEGQDLTVPEIAERMHRHANTVRDWIRAGQLRAYRLQGREYRVTEAALAEFLEAQKNPTPPASSAGRPADLGSWRKHRKAS